MARKNTNAAVADKETDDEELYTITMIEPQYNHLYGRLEPGDEVDMDLAGARRWVGLKIAECEAIPYDTTKVPGRVRKIHPYEEPANTGPNMNPQMAALQSQVEELTRLVQSQMGGGQALPASAPSRRSAPASERASARAQTEAQKEPLGKPVDVPNPSATPVDEKPADEKPADDKS